ncbi:MAG: polysaccharide deacetylase family protein [Clostridia bacterium]|nr:polysaccharide deacetylase family protein [Clostridia bacterium]
MWNGKNKAITFSFDDGVTQDVRLVEILNRYGLKCTFNLNSGYMGVAATAPDAAGRWHHRLTAAECKDLYAGHEVAVHTVTHPTLVGLPEEKIVWEVEEDRKTLEKLFGYPIVGMAYPNGPNDDRVAGIIRAHTPICYSRTVTSTYSFELQKDSLLRFNPTLHLSNESAEEVIDRFLALETDRPQLLYIWGHSYEMDNSPVSWGKFETICQKLSGKEDIFYGTNKEVLL